MAFRGDLETLVLGVLASEPRHGYEIVRRVRATDDDALKVNEGQLYPLLHRLENDGLVVAEWVPQEGKPPRKVYALTARGRGALDARRESWKRFSRAVDGLLTPEPSHG
jgi:PadR family transcriptional regulator, regulatory protein PadR